MKIQINYGSIRKVGVLGGPVQKGQGAVRLVPAVRWHQGYHNLVHLAAVPDPDAGLRQLKNVRGHVRGRLPANNQRRHIRHRYQADAGSL